MSQTTVPVAAKPSLLSTVKAWLYVPSNRTAVVAFLTSAITELGHVADHSISPLAAVVPLTYGIVHLLFPDFSLTGTQLATLGAIAESAKPAPAPAAPIPATPPIA